MKTSKPALALPLLLSLGLGCPEGGDDGDGEVAAYCETCDLDHWLPALAVDGATDCGEVRLGERATEAAACVDAALASAKPFMVRQELQGIDSRVELGFVVDHDGVVQALTYDSNVCGSSGCDERCGPTVWARECVAPRTGAMPEQALVDCDDGESAALCGPLMTE